MRCQVCSLDADFHFPLPSVVLRQIKVQELVHLDQSGSRNKQIEKLHNRDHVPGQSQEVSVNREL